MPKSYDVTTKELVTQFPLDLLHFAGLRAKAAEVLTTDLSTISTEADYALRVQIDALLFYIAHFEFQASYDADLDERVLRYNVFCATCIGWRCKASCFCCARKPTGRK